MHATFENMPLQMTQDCTKVLRRSEETMSSLRVYLFHAAFRGRSLSHMSLNPILRNTLLLRWEGSHPGANSKHVFLHHKDCGAAGHVDQEE